MDDEDIPLLMTENDDRRRNYVFNECKKLMSLFEKEKKIQTKKLEMYQNNNFYLTIFNENNIIIQFIENNKQKYLLTTHHIRKVKIKYLEGEDKEFWLVNLDILNYYLKILNVRYPIFNMNNLDCTLNEESYEIFIESNCTIIYEGDKPEINYDEIKNNLNEFGKFSIITLSNNKYFKDSYNQNKFDEILISNSYKFRRFIEKISKNKFDKIKVIKNSKSGFSSLLYSNLKKLKSLSSNFNFFYIDLRFYNDASFTSEEKTEALLKEGVFSVSNNNEYNELKKKILKFNIYSTLLKKIKMLINYFKIQENKTILVFDHINFEYLNEFNVIFKSNEKKISFIQIFSLEEFTIQDIFLEQIDINPNQREYYLLLNYPQIIELPKKYSILNNNPYYYGIENSNISKKSFNQICIEERIKIFEILDKFYKDNIKNLFNLLSIKYIIGKTDINYSINKNIFRNIPLDLFKIELNNYNKGIKKIEYKNYLIKKSIKNFIRKKFLTANTESEIIEEIKGRNKIFVLKELFNIFYTSDKLPFTNIKYVSEVIVDKIINNSKIIIDNNYSILDNFDKENIFISQDNDNAKNYDSALILNYENKKILKIYHVTEGEKKSNILKEKYTKKKLKDELLNVSYNLENLLNLKFNIIEFKFVLNFYTYEKNGLNEVEFCNTNNINYILFDYKNFFLYNKNKERIRELKIDNNSIIFEKNNIINDFYNEEEFYSEEGQELNNISNIKKEKIIKTNLNESNSFDDDLLSNIIENKNNGNNKIIINIEENEENSFGENGEEEIDDSRFFDLKKKIKNLRIIKGANGIKIGISNSEKGSYCGNIFNRAQRLKEIKDLELEFRIYLSKKISIKNLINTYRLKDNQFIHIYINKNFYLIFVNNKKFEVYNENYNSKHITLIENPENIILEEKCSILVFHFKRKEYSQLNISEKRKKIKETEYITTTC